MPNQEESPDGRPRKETDRPSPDVHGEADGQVGVTSDRQRDLVAPSGVNERDRGSADDPAAAGGTVNLDDDTLEHPRGNTSRSQGTWAAQGGDSGRIDKAPGAGQSDRIGPSDPANRSGRSGH